MNILGIGDADIDIFIEVDKVPSHDEKVFSRSTSQCVGGMVLNFLICLKNLGNSCEFVGVIGEDKFGGKILSFLKEFSIVIDNIVIDKEGETYYCYVILDDLGEKSLIIVPTNCLFISEDKIKEKIFLRKTHVHTTSGDIDTAFKVINLAKKNKVSVSIDVENVDDFGLFSKLISNVDLLFINFNTFKKIGFEDLSKGLEEIIKHGPKVICLTKGKYGSTTYTRENSYSFDGFSVEVKDTTGAGDCFAAGFVHGYIRNWSLEKNTIFANAVASLSTTTLGGSSFMMSYTDVQSFINSHKLTKND